MALLHMASFIWKVSSIGQLCKIQRHHFKDQPTKYAKLLFGMSNEEQCNSQIKTVHSSNQKYHHSLLNLCLIQRQAYQKERNGSNFLCIPLLQISYIYLMKDLTVVDIVMTKKALERCTENHGMCI